MGRALVGVPVALLDRLPSLADLNPVAPDIVIGTGSTPKSVNAATHATPHSKGAWVELIAATTEQYDGIVLNVQNSSASGADSAVLLDVGIGAAAAEVVVAGNLEVGFRGAVICPLSLAVNIPVGSRVAVRVQGTRVSVNVPVQLLGVLNRRDRRRSPSALVSMGVNTGTSVGTTLTAPGSTNTKAAWTEIIAATTQPLEAITLMVGMPSGTTAQSAGNGLADVAIGAAGNEVVVLSNLYFAPSSAEAINQQFNSRTVAIDIPSGVRVSARYQANSTAITATASIIGVPRS